MYPTLKIISTFLVLHVANLACTQASDSLPTRFILGSVHFSTYLGDETFREHVWKPGVSLEYRSDLDKLAHNFSLKWGVGIETVPLKEIRQNDEFFTDVPFNLTLPIGIYYTAKRHLFVGCYTSIDIPFFTKEHARFGNVDYHNSEFSFRYLNINFSAGAVVGKVFTLNDRYYLLELNYKSLAIFGNTSNDYWLYPEGRRPHYIGLRFGVGI